MTEQQEIYMQRSLQLAALGKGLVAPNPLVGAVLVHEGRIIGEGYHRKYGETHAEVNCLSSVTEQDRALIEKSTLYINLEPCVHYGKTPPCTDLILKNHIPRVVIGTEDPFIQVRGRGIQKLKEGGVEVELGILAKNCRWLNRRFFSFQEKQRPYTILKWAQSRNGLIAYRDKKPAKISNSFTDRLNHRWRSEEAAIMVGAGTVIADDPRLTNRLWAGGSPVRLIWDRNLEIPENSKVLDGESKTLVFHLKEAPHPSLAEYIQLPGEGEFITGIWESLYERQINSMIVEGGAKLLQLFIDGGYWDEARVITGNIFLEDGVAAPLLKKASLVEQFQVEGDWVDIFEKKDQPAQ